MSPEPNNDASYYALIYPPYSSCPSFISDEAFKLHLEDSDSIEEHLHILMPDNMEDFPEDDSSDQAALFAARIAKALFPTDTDSGYRIIKTYLRYHPRPNSAWKPKEVSAQTPRDINMFITQKCGPYSTAVSTRAALTLWYRTVRPNESTIEWRMDEDAKAWRGRPTRSPEVSRFMIGLEKTKAKAGEVSQLQLPSSAQGLLDIKSPLGIFILVFSLLRRKIFIAMGNGFDNCAAPVPMFWPVTLTQLGHSSGRTTRALTNVYDSLQTRLNANMPLVVNLRLTPQGLVNSWKNSNNIFTDAQSNARVRSAKKSDKMKKHYIVEIVEILSFVKLEPEIKPSWVLMKSRSSGFLCVPCIFSSSDPEWLQSCLRRGFGKQWAQSARMSVHGRMQKDAERVALRSRPQVICPEFALHGLDQLKGEMILSQQPLNLLVNLLRPYKAWHLSTDTQWSYYLNYAKRLNPAFYFPTWPATAFNIILSSIRSIQFRSMSSEGTPLHTIFLQSPARSVMVNVLHIMQADALNQLMVKELDPHNVGTGCYVLADSWTTDCLFSSILHFPSAANPCIKFIPVQHSCLCKI
ncbi:hypothetical protein B0H17DRAFT_1144391 [Mycena rosella]|uniref:Uncharacterized protein n=1 Tax=Mycena rosella TaxID=1033263 RepID=A0AAD7G5S0_MYCRO|nr:hypothetical protein B0H17DRAFT_1144391 [Mycena rosella]